jgi:hypothetical protein
MDIQMDGWISVRMGGQMNRQMNRKTVRELHAPDYIAWVKHQLKDKS